MFKATSSASTALRSGEAPHFDAPALRSPAFVPATPPDERSYERRSPGGSNRPRPTIETAAYTFDRVHRIEVVQEVPDHLAELGCLDGWRAMARAEAFERLMQQVDVNASFTVECHFREGEEIAPDDRPRRVVICELRYAFNR